MTTRQNHPASRRGFTILEGLTVAGVIILLMSLALVAATRGLRAAKMSSERHHVASIKIGIEQFKRDFGLPPLVDDVGPGNVNDPSSWDPIDGTEGQPRLFRTEDMAAWTRGSDSPRYQYSVFSIPYYLMGLLDVEHGGDPIDGATGPRLTRVENGKFVRRGTPVNAVFTGGEDARRIHRNPDKPEQIMYLDQWGVRSGVPEDHAIRYYRWERNPPNNNDPNLPAAVGKAELKSGTTWVIEDVELRSAKYAIVSAGPDGLINDDNAEAKENQDNIVEVGR